MSVAQALFLENPREEEIAVNRSVGGLFGRGNHVVDPQDEDVVHVVFPVDVALDAELRERRWAYSNGIALVKIVDRALDVDLRAAEVGVVDAREGDLLDNDALDVLALVFEGDGLRLVHLLDL